MPRRTGPSPRASWAGAAPGAAPRAAWLACAALLALTGLVGVAAAQELTRWPTPPDGWWDVLEAGEQATYVLSQGGQEGRRVMTVERLEGSRVTVSFEQSVGGGAPIRQLATVDLADPTDQGDLALPEGATLTRRGAEELKVGDRLLRCDVYDVVVEGPAGRVALTTWHAAKLPPVFMGGVVKLTSTSGGGEASITLVEYKGRLLE